MAAGARVCPCLGWRRTRGQRSRTRPRALAARTNHSEATRLLERPYRFSVPVVRGPGGLGRGLGLPTANLQVERSQIPAAEGVYAAWARLVGRSRAFGRDGSGDNLRPPNPPWTPPGLSSAVEVHLLDGSWILEARELEVEAPWPCCASNSVFDNLEELSAQNQCRTPQQARQLLRLEPGRVISAAG